MIRELLGAPSDSVVECATGEDALKVVGDFKPDCVTMDIRRPDLSDLEAARAIRAALKRAGLDAEATRNLQAVLGRLAEEGKAVVFSTHDFEQGAAVARRLVALAGGRVRYDGPLGLAPRGTGA